jgi:hypothetical protein
MGRLGFTSSRADPDVWFRLSTRSTGEEYYEYVLLYVDNVLVISENAEAVMRIEIGKYWKIKEELIGPLTKYLGGKLCEVELETGVKAWAFGSQQYVQTAVTNVCDHLAKTRRLSLFALRAILHFFAKVYSSYLAIAVGR